MDILDFINLEKCITCLYGEAGSGKTNISILAAAKASETGKVLFIDTENTFSPRRAQELSPNAKLENIIIVSPKHFFSLHKAIFNLLKIKCSLIIIDSINRYYRKRLTVDERTNEFFGKQLRILNQIAKTTPILITGQVYSSPEYGTMPSGGNMLKDKCGQLFLLEKKEKRVIAKEKPDVNKKTFEVNAGSITLL